MVRAMCLALLALASSLPACAQVTVAWSNAYDFYSPEYAGYVASRGPIPAVILGDPFGPSADPVVVSQIPPPAFVAHASFLPGNPFTSLDFDRVVLAFNPAPGFQAYDLCARPDIPTAGAQPQPRSVQLLAALCRGRYVVSQALLYAPPIASPQDPQLRELMSQTILALFPPRQNLPHPHPFHRRF
jgi:hypothetical protein